MMSKTHAAWELPGALGVSMSAALDAVRAVGLRGRLQAGTRLWSAAEVDCLREYLALVRKCRQGQCDAHDLGRLRGLTSVADRVGHGEDAGAVIRLAEQNVRDDYDAGYLAGLKEAGGIA